jgi:MFS family permease
VTLRADPPTLWAGASAVGLAVGPVAGAMLTQTLGWPWVFLINVPLGVVAAAAARRFIPESSAGRRERRLPWPAVFLWAGALLSLVTALTEASTIGWTALEVLALGGVGAVLLGLLIAVERRSQLRLIEPSLLHSRQTVGANVLSLMSTAVMCNVFFFIALYLQLVLGYRIVRAGATLLPLTATIVLVAPPRRTALRSDRIGRRAPIITGLLLLAAGLIVLSALRERSGATLLISGLTLTGVGIGFTTSPIIAAAMDRATDQTTGESAGLLNTARMIGPYARDRDDGRDHRQQRQRPGRQSTRPRSVRHRAVTRSADQRRNRAPRGRRRGRHDHRRDPTGTSAAHRWVPRSQRLPRSQCRRHRPPCEAMRRRLAIRRAPAHRSPAGQPIASASHGLRLCERLRDGHRTAGTGVGVAGSPHSSHGRFTCAAALVRDESLAAQLAGGFFE